MIATKRRIEKSTGILNATPSYDTATEFTDGAYHTIVTAHCIECGGEGRLHWNTGGNHPDFVARKYRGMGWQFDAYRPRKCVCPECVTGKKSPAGAPATQEEPDDMAKSNSYTPPTTDTAVLRAAQTMMEGEDITGRALTANEKARVRRLLDSHFDDQLGRYIDNYDDERVSKETNIPRAFVSEYRELAYGPLKADPAVEAVKAEAVALRQEFVELSHALDAIRARVASVEGKLVNVEAKAKKL